MIGQRSDSPLKVAHGPLPRVSPDGEWIGFEVVTTSGRAAGMRFRVRRDWVELWRGEHCSATFDRDRLRAWLNAMPSEPYEVDDVVLSVERSLDPDGDVAISLMDVRQWVLAPLTVAVLRKRV